MKRKLKTPYETPRSKMRDYAISFQLLGGSNEPIGGGDDPDIDWAPQSGNTDSF